MSDKDITSDEDAASDKDTLIDESAESNENDGKHFDERLERDRASISKLQGDYCKRSSAEERRVQPKREKTRQPRRYDNDDDEEDDTFSDADSFCKQRRIARRINRCDDEGRLRSYFTIKDVEGSLSYFTGDDKLPI